MFKFIVDFFLLLCRCYDTHPTQTPSLSSHSSSTSQGPHKQVGRGTCVIRHMIISITPPNVKLAIVLHVGDEWNLNTSGWWQSLKCEYFVYFIKILLEHEYKSRLRLRFFGLWESGLLWSSRSPARRSSWSPASRAAHQVIPTSADPFWSSHMHGIPSTHSGIAIKNAERDI